MALYDTPEHTVTTYTATTAADAGGGTTYTYTAADANVRCLVNTASAATVALFAQQQIRVTHTVAFRSAALTTPLVRAMRLVDATGRSFYIEGIRIGRAMGSVPALTYADCSELI